MPRRVLFRGRSPTIGRGRRPRNRKSRLTDDSSRTSPSTNDITTSASPATQPVASSSSDVYHPKANDISLAIASLNVSQNNQTGQEQDDHMDTSSSNNPRPPLLPDVDTSHWEPSKAPPSQTSKSSVTFRDVVNARSKSHKDHKVREAALQRKKSLIKSVVTFLNKHNRRSANSGPKDASRRNPAASLSFNREQQAPHSTFEVEPYSIEELTAYQFRTVFNYITTNNVLRDQVRGLVVPAPETTPARPADFEEVAKIVHLLKNLLNIVQNATSSFHDLAILLVGRQPSDIRRVPSCKRRKQALQEETQRPASHSNQRTTITIPRLPRYRSGPRSQRSEGREAGLSSIFDPVTAPTPPGAGKRRYDDGNDFTTTLLPPLKARRSPTANSFSSRPEDADALVAAKRRRAAPRSRFPTRTRKRPTGTWVEFCAFCEGRDHYTSDCPSFPYLSSRACKAEKAGICSNCVKSHYGVCIRRDPCTICKEEGHHRAFCVQNPWVALDITMSPEQFYEELRNRTYRHPPPGATTRRRYSHSYKDREKAGQDEPQKSSPRPGDEPAVHQASPRGEKSAKLSDHDSDESC
ncbi:hypothetical protein COOONC_16450 [Cooperia oncophora]